MKCQILYIWFVHYLKRVYTQSARRHFKHDYVSCRLQKKNNNWAGLNRVATPRKLVRYSSDFPTTFCWLNPRLITSSFFAFKSVAWKSTLWELSDVPRGKPRPADVEELFFLLPKILLLKKKKTASKSMSPCIRLKWTVLTETCRSPQSTSSRQGLSWSNEINSFDIKHRSNAPAPAERPRDGVFVSSSLNLPTFLSHVNTRHIPAHRHDFFWEGGGLQTET